jgi:hypothetical protein
MRCNDFGGRPRRHGMKFLYHVNMCPFRGLPSGKLGIFRVLKSFSEFVVMARISKYLIVLEDYLLNIGLTFLLYVTWLFSGTTTNKI